MSVENEKGKYAAPSVDGLLDILELIAGERRPFGPTELSRSLGISNNLVFRIMRRLTQRGYAEMDADGRYTLGAKFMAIGLSIQASFELRRRARRRLEELCERTGETSQIQVLDGEEMLCLDSVAPNSFFYLAVTPGSRLKIHANAFGKALLAFLPEDSRESLLKTPFELLTSKSLRSPEEIKAQLPAVRATGLAYDLEEYATGVICIGAPVFGADGLVKAGMGVTGISSRLVGDRKAEAGELVLKAAETLSAELGYNGEFFKKLRN